MMPHLSKGDINTETFPSGPFRKVRASGKALALPGDRLLARGFQGLIAKPRAQDNAQRCKVPAGSPGGTLPPPIRDRCRPNIAPVGTECFIQRTPSRLHNRGLSKRFGANQTSQARCPNNPSRGSPNTSAFVVVPLVLYFTAPAP